MQTTNHYNSKCEWAHNNPDVILVEMHCGSVWGWRFSCWPTCTNHVRNMRHVHLTIHQKHMAFIYNAVVFGLSCPSGSWTPHPSVLYSAFCWISTGWEPEPEPGWHSCMWSHSCCRSVWNRKTQTLIDYTVYTSNMVDVTVFHLWLYLITDLLLCCTVSQLESLIMGTNCITKGMWLTLQYAVIFLFILSLKTQSTSPLPCSCFLVLPEHSSGSCLSSPRCTCCSFPVISL